MAIRPILQFPDPVLKKRATKVDNLTGDVAQLIEDMTETMYAAPGVGLAATQVGVGQRVIVLDIHEENDEPGKPCEVGQPGIVEQPRILLEEGCPLGSRPDRAVKPPVASSCAPGPRGARARDRAEECRGRAPARDDTSR